MFGLPLITEKALLVATVVFEMNRQYVVPDTKAVSYLQSGFSYSLVVHIGSVRTPEVSQYELSTFMDDLSVEVGHSARNELEVVGVMATDADSPQGRKLEGMDLLLTCQQQDLIFAFVFFR